mmetsp:Transcript_2621/g.9671  ORF Transcript_2621/g.9671 Transcript_2621/m.9671 type:complete len:328 (+) Transcript_2621:458-1441(+)
MALHRAGGVFFEQKVERGLLHLRQARALAAFAADDDVLHPLHAQGLLEPVQVEPLLRGQLRLVPLEAEVPPQVLRELHPDAPVAQERDRLLQQVRLAVALQLQLVDLRDVHLPRLQLLLQVEQNLAHDHRLVPRDEGAGLLVAHDLYAVHLLLDGSRHVGQVVAQHELRVELLFEVPSDPRPVNGLLLLVVDHPDRGAEHGPLQQPLLLGGGSGGVLVLRPIGPPVILVTLLALLRRLRQGRLDLLLRRHGCRRRASARRVPVRVVLHLLQLPPQLFRRLVLLLVRSLPPAGVGLHVEESRRLVVDHDAPAPRDVASLLLLLRRRRA